MRKTTGLALLLAAGAATLASAPAAFAAYSPTVAVSRSKVGGKKSTTDITFQQTSADDATVRIQLLPGLGLSVGLGQAPGTKLGTMEGSVMAAGLGGATIPVEGTITATDPTSPDFTAAAEVCTGQATHNAVWLLNVSAAGQPLPAPVPLFVDMVSTPPFNAFASGSIQLCLPNPSQAAFGIKLLSATLHLPGVFTASRAGKYFWTAIETPYNADGTVNIPGTIETQSLDRAPLSVPFSVKRIAKTRKVKRKRGTDVLFTYFTKLRGKALPGGTAAVGASVGIFAGKRKVASLKTNKKGAFSKTLKLKRTTSYHAVLTQKTMPLVGASCQPALPLMPCGTITQGGFTAKTKTLRVKKPKLTVKHLKKKH